jgi:hypothetical protein
MRNEGSKNPSPVNFWEKTELEELASINNVLLLRNGMQRFLINWSNWKK